MNKGIRIGLALLALAALGAAAPAAKKQVDRWLASRPTQHNLEAAIKELMQRQALAREKPRGWALCARIPVTYPEPDARSRTLRPTGWHVDFLKDAPVAAERARQLEQLDALAGAGLLVKADALVARAGQLLPATRYSLTDKGWVSSAYPFCLAYGEVAYLGFVSAKEIEYEGRKLQEVAVRIGIPNADRLADWARDPTVQAAFPDIRKDLEGRRFNYVLQWRDDAWREFRPGDGGGEPPKFEDLPAEEQRQLQARAALPDPDREELQRVIFASHAGTQDCAHLPGSERLPVDRLLISNDSPTYRVGIYLDKSRTPQDRVATKTIPLAEKLASVGALVRYPPQRVQGEGREAGQLFDMVTYELSPQLQQLLPRYGSRTCLPLGPRTLTLLDAKYRKLDPFGLPVPWFTYKARVTLNQPPAELTDPVLLAAWPDLRGVLEHGLACAGEFQFNKEQRRSEAGGGSCWHDFDSEYEDR